MRIDSQGKSRAVHVTVLTVYSVDNSTSMKNSEGFRNNMKDCSCTIETKLHLPGSPIDWKEALEKIVLILLILAFSCGNRRFMQTVL